MLASEVVKKLNDPDVIDDHGVVTVLIHQDWNNRDSYAEEFHKLLKSIGYDRSFGIRKFYGADPQA